MPEGAKRVLIIANLDKDDSGGLARQIEERLASLGVGTSTFAFAGAPGKSIDIGDHDLVVSLGGDGTVLYAARMAAAFGIPIMPFNLGRLGFIAGFNRSDWDSAFELWMEGRLPLSARAMLSISVLKAEGCGDSFLALNDGVISAQGIAKLISLDIRVGDTALGLYRSDGVIVSTSTGSTAYNLAAGGPILHPEMDAMILNPICPFTLSNRPLVMPGTERLDILVEEGKRTGVMLTVDGQETCVLSPGDHVYFTRAPHRALIYAPERHAFYDVLRSKLSWSGGADA